MTERRAYAVREPWPQWKRLLVVPARFVFRSLLNRNGDALSWSACALTLFLIVEAKRLLPIPWENGTKIVPIIGWPDLFLCLLILWGRWIDDAAQKVAERDPDKIVETILPRLIGRLGIGDTAAGNNNGGYTPDDTLPRVVPPDAEPLG